MRAEFPISKRFGTALLLAAGTLLMFGILTRPLPAYWTRGIPASARNLETPPARTNIAGDHLQLLYHFDLVGDMFTGRIRPFHNPYEFNTGDEEERFRPGSYFFPASGLYALLRPILGQAGAWNTVLWVSVWLGGCFAWLWFGRFTDSAPAKVLGVAVWLAAPFRWASLLGGSPAGIAMMWVPLYAWTVDRALTRSRIRDGAAAGALLLLLFWADLQVFYLTAVTTPVCVGLTLLWKPGRIRTVWRSWPRLLPGGLLFLAVIGVFYVWRKSHLSGSHMEDGRSWAEMALFSPRAADLWHAAAGPGETVFIGFWVGTLLILGLLQTAWRSPRERLPALLFAAACIAGGVALALGPHGPFNGGAIRFVRTALPYYDMIRQPFKIFAVVPLWMAWMCAAAFPDPPPKPLATRGRAALLSAVLAAGVLWSQGRHVKTTISLIPEEQPVYAAVAADAARMGIRDPHVLVIPLWPGDSAETSLPMHFARRYHLRMVNGYSPVVGTRYTEETFRALESVNQGRLTDEQVERLHQIGVRHLIVHANQFPEKVSPFPIRETLRRLDAHPWLQRLKQDGPLHAFRLRETPEDPGPSHWREVPDLRVPARRYDADRLPEARNSRRVADPGAHGGHAVRLTPESPTLETPAARIAPDPGNRWWIRVRGTGRLRASTLPAQTDPPPAGTSLALAAPDWKWISLPLLPETEAFLPRRLHLSVSEGVLDVDLILLSGPRSLLDLPPEGLRIPASLFFHAGYADPETEAVHFRPETDPDRTVWYGPLLPLSPGRYRFRVRHDHEADGGTALGTLASGYHGAPPDLELPVVGTSTEWVATMDHTLLWRLEFRYHRRAKVSIRDVEIVPVQDSGE